MLSIKNRNALIALIVLFKIFLLIYFIFQLNPSDSFINIFISNDYSELLGPVDNLVQTGTYEYVKNSNIPYTDRMPGYMFPYVMFRYIFSQKIAVLLLISFQIIFSIIASLCLFKLIYLMTKKTYLSFLVFIIFFLFSFLTPWELWTYPESLSVSCYIFGLLFTYMSIGGKKINLIYGGLFFAWMFFLRGFLGGYFLLPILFIILSSKSLKNSFVRVLIFLIPLIFIQFFWVSRNYYSKGEVIFLQSKFVQDHSFDFDNEYPFNSSYKPSILDLRKLISLWGGNNVKYYTNSEMGYFLNEKTASVDTSFPDWIFKKEFSKDRLIYLKELVQNSYLSEQSELNRIEAEKKLIAYVAESHNVFNEIHGNKIFISSISRIKNLLVNNIVANWPGESFSKSSILVKIYKLSVVFIFYLLILFSIISFLLKNNFNKKDKFFRICLSLSFLYLLFLFSFVINIAEFKYTATLFVSCTILSTPTIDSIFIKLSSYTKSFFRT